MRCWTRLLVLALAASTAPVQAHHSLTGYDQSRLVALTGLVTEFRFTQPHPFLTIEVETAGSKQAWRMEMDNLWELREIGFSAESFRRGDRVLVSGNPNRDGSNRLYLRRLDRPSDSLRYEQAGTTPTVTVRPKP